MKTAEEILKEKLGVHFAYLYFVDKVQEALREYASQALDEAKMKSPHAAYVSNSVIDEIKSQLK